MKRITKFISFVISIDIDLIIQYYKPLKGINDVLHFLNLIPYINNGGCGISALSIARYLKLSEASDNFILLYRKETDDDNRYDHNSKVINGDDEKPVATSHVGVFGLTQHNIDNNHYIDSGGSSRIIDYYRWHIINEKILVEAIKNESTWNSDFNRRFIPLIEKKLKISLSDIKSL